VQGTEPRKERRLLKAQVCKAVVCQPQFEARRVGYLGFPKEAGLLKLFNIMCGQAHDVQFQRRFNPP
jgi:hypothetical protein